MKPIEESAMYQALVAIGVDVELAREATEEYRDRTTIPEDVTTRALYGALSINGKAPEETVRRAVESVRDMPAGEKWVHP